MPVITMTGFLGSGALEIGEGVAAKLGIGYVDQEILVGAARALGVTVGAVEERDERPSSFGQRLSLLLRNFLERSAAAGAADPMMGTGGLEILLAHTYGEAAAGRTREGQQLDDNTYIKTITGIIRELGERGNVVIVGRGSPVILKDLAGATHVYVSASFEDRVRLLSKRDNQTVEEATKRVQEGAKTRIAFFRKFFRVEIQDPSLYDLMVNTSRLSLEAATELVAAAAQCKAPRPG